MAGNTLILTICNQSSCRLPMIHDQQLLALRWHTVSGGGRAGDAGCFQHNGSRYIKNRYVRTIVNMWLVTAAYPKATISSETRNAKPEIGTDWSDPSRQKCWLTAMGPCLTRQEAADLVFGRIWNQTHSFWAYKPGPLAGYPSPLLTLPQTLSEFAFWRIIIKKLETN